MPIGSFDEFRRELAHRYRIEREIGHGGMATVYLARDLKLGRLVALKVLRREVAQVLGEERFKREIELAAPLNHPNILPFIDSDQAAGRLFYVMPYVEGGTLADRLARGPRPTLTEALEITRQVAAGLSYAHSIGVIHRDIKPANILLATGHAWLADFGIARMFRDAITDTAERLTETGLAIGTAEYMPPEQLRGASKVDGRADEYSLACVLFEMLTGKLPSSSAGRPGALRQELRAAGLSLPTAVETALERALAIETEARFPTVAAFAAALEGAVEPSRIRRRSPSKSAVLGAALVAVVVVATMSRWASESLPCPAVPLSDTTGYAVFPFEHGSGVPPIGEEQLLTDAFGRWSGLHVADQFQVREVAGRTSAGPILLEKAREIACKVGVRRLVLGNIARIPNRDSVRIFARTYDLGPGNTSLGPGTTVRLSISQADADSLFRILADSLLFRGHPPEGGPALAGTRVLGARQAFDSGQRALAGWNLPAADSAFHLAVTLDQEYPAANLWLALVRTWQDPEATGWVAPAERAGARAASLRRTDSIMAIAVNAMAHGDLAHACRSWRLLAHMDPNRFAAWYGLSECLRRDSVVVADRASISGWRFRSSYHEAQRAYLKAIQLLPSILASPGNTVTNLSADLLYINDARLRRGRAAPPDTTSFRAAAGWTGDTLVFIPLPQSRNGESFPAATPGRDEAVRRQRLLLDTLALTWVTEAPRSIEARLALIEAMALAVDPAAVDSARAARRLAHNASELVRILAAEVRTRIQFGVPDHREDILLARALADSILDGSELRQAADPSVITALAVLTGRAHEAAQAARRAAALPSWDLPKPLLEAAPALLIYSAMGGPKDSIRALWRLTRDAIERAMPAEQRLDRAMEDLGRPTTLAFPLEILPSLEALRGKGDWLLTLQADFAREGSSVVRRWVDSTAATGQLGNGVWTFDTAWPVAALLAYAGDTTRAVQLLDGALGTIRFRSHASFGNPVEIATMVRSMMLRAQLAARIGDRATARRWAGAVVALSEGGDRTFDEEMAVMRELAR